MSVNSVNSVAFTGKVATTKNGNEYKKTNAGKIVGTAVAAGAFARSAYFVNKTVGFKTYFARIADIVGGSSKKAGATLAVAVAMAVGTYVGAGAIVDKLVNHHRAKVADKAETNVAE